MNNDDFFEKKSWRDRLGNFFSPQRLFNIRESSFLLLLLLAAMMAAIIIFDPVGAASAKISEFLEARAQAKQEKIEAAKKRAEAIAYVDSLFSVEVGLLSEDLTEKEKEQIESGLSASFFAARVYSNRLARMEDVLESRDADTPVNYLETPFLNLSFEDMKKGREYFLSVRKDLVIRLCEVYIDILRMPREARSKDPFLGEISGLTAANNIVDLTRWYRVFPDELEIPGNSFPLQKMDSGQLKTLIAKVIKEETGRDPDYAGAVSERVNKVWGW